MSGLQLFPVFECPVFGFLLYSLISYLFSIWPSNFDKSINVSHSWNVIGNERFESSLQLNGLRGVPDDVVKQLLHFSLKTVLYNHPK